MNRMANFWRFSDDTFWMEGGGLYGGNLYMRMPHVNKRYFIAGTVTYGKSVASTEPFQIVKKSRKMSFR